MFSKILVATDLSKASSMVIETLGGLKKLGAEEAKLVHCLNIRDVGSLADSLIELVEPELEKQKKLLEQQGFRTTTKIALGLPQVEINSFAEQCECSMIVIGSHGHSMSDELSIGSMANAIVKSATIPVLIIHLKLRIKRGETDRHVKWNPMEHVLFPTDFSDNAEHAFSYVEKIAESGAKKVTLLHVQDKGKIGKHLKDRLEEFNRIDTERLERLKSELEKRGKIETRIELPYGLPKKEIIERINQGDISLVVLGMQGRGFVRELLLGSVSHSVINHSASNVLVVPAIK